MANKFQKSVLERLEQEASRQKHSGKASNASVAPKPERLEKKVELENQEQAPSAPRPEPVSPEAPQRASARMELDINSFLRRETHRQAKNKTFYLDVKVIEAIHSTARAQKVTDSKLVNDILMRVLGCED